jgi:hypothetical protein
VHLVGFNYKKDMKFSLSTVCFDSLMIRRLVGLIANCALMLCREASNQKLKYR